MNGCKQRTRVRARTVLAVGLSVIMTFGGLPASALAQMQEQAEQAQDSNMPELTGSLPVEEFAATDDGPSNDDLFTGYVQKLVAETLPEGSSDVGEIEAVEQSAAESLEGNDLLAYNKLKPMIEEVAAGRRQSTVFEIPITDLGYNGPWTAAALGVDAIVENGQISNDAMAAASARMEVNASRVVRALLADCPYDLYWFDKTQGNSCGLSGGFGAGGQNGQYVLYCPEGSTWSISFVVSADYAEGGSATTVRSDVLSAVQDAFNNAQSIVNQYANLPAYERLKAYKDEICNRVSYNTAAAQGQVSSKNPWQLIWALDNDPNTTVVCEGYSKAFKYLCDLSGLRNVECLLVSGNMSGGTGAGAHMWNIVNMDDGRNYMVDVTNCDGDVETNNYSVGFPNELFMAYGPAGSVDTTYTFTTKQRPVAEGSSSYLPASSIVYNYDADTRANYPDEALAYADSAYAGPVAQSVSLEDATVTFASEPTYNGEVQKLAPIVILDGETLTKDVDYAVSYEPANPRNAGEVMVTVSGLGDYEGSATGAYTIARKVVTVSADDKAKEYGEADPELTATVEGTLGSDQVAYELSRAAGEEPGEYAIVASGAAEQGNYTVAYQPGTLTIGQVPATQISVPAAASGLVYNGDAQVGVAAGEGYALSGATSATNAGDYIATAILKDGYVWDDGTSEDKSIEWSIARKAVTVSADDKAKAYGEADPELTATVTGTLGSDKVAYELSRAAGEDAGTYAITPTGDDEQGNYTVTFVPGTLTIGEAPATQISVPFAAAGLVYDGTEQVGVAQGVGYVLSGTSSATNAGNYIATVTLESGYVWGDGSTDAKSIAWSIAPKSVTVRADDKTKAYGEDDPELTATVTGLVGDDEVAFVLAREAGEDVGAYVIMPTGDVEQGNYEVTYTMGTLSIARAQAAVPSAAQWLIYNGAEQEGVAEGDGYTLVGTTQATNAGSYEAIATPDGNHVWADGTTGAKVIAWSIARKAVTVKVDDKSKKYGENDPELTATVTGTLGSDTVSYTLSRAAGEDVGTYAITSAGDAEQGNYAVTYQSGIFTIVKTTELVPIAVPTGVAGLVYNGDDQVGVEEGAGYTLGGTTVAMVAGDYIATATLKSGYVWADGSTDAKVISWSIARMPIDLPAVAEGLVYNGARQIGIEKGEGYPGYSLVGVVGAMDAGTYDATVTPDKNHCWKDGTYETKQLVWYIAPKPINVPTANAGLVYNGEEQVGVETGEGYLCDYPSAATKVGSYETPVSLLDNYCWSDGSTEDKSIAWSIAPKSVTVRADDKTKAYGEDDPELTATVTGLVGDDEVAFVLAREAGEDVGAYAITPTGDVGQGNYTVTYQPGTLTIEEAPATQIAIPVAASGLVYDGTEQVGVEPGEGYTLSGAASATDAGDYLVTATLKDGYVWDDGTTEAKEIAWSIARKAVTVRADDKSKVYGDADPDLTATVTGTLADDVVEYALSREAGNNVGTYAITAAGDAEQGNYAVAFKSGTLTIARAVIAVPKATNCTYNGKAQTGVTVGTGYSLSGTTSATNAGTYKPTATPDGNHCWADGTYAAKTIQWSIAPLSVANATVASVAMQLYTGSAITPKPKITYSGATLKEGTDYALAYKNNVNLGTATITITGKGNFTGSRSVTFKIAKSVAKLTVTAPKAQTYTGKALTPKPTVKDGSKTLVLGTDYTLAYKNNVNAGTATVTITGKGNYTGTRSVTFTIAKKASTISLAAQTKTYNGKVLAYSGKVTKTGSTGKVTYKYYSDAKCTKAVAATSVKATKTYYVKGTLAADANHTGKTSDAAKFIIAKATQPMTATAANKTASFATLKTKAVTVARPITISKAQGTLSYAKVASGSSAALTVNKTTGKVTVKKGTKKGTYTIKIKVAAAGNANYKAGSKNVTCKVVVK